MKNATFYLLEQYTTSNTITAMEMLACDLAIAKWRNGKRVLIACKDDSQAIRLDEVLWAQYPDTFVPHNLAGEGPYYGAPVEICWPQRGSNALQDLLINLLPDCADFASTFHEVIDFIPYENTFKKLARDRYKAYRNVGFRLTISTLPKYS